MSPLSRRAFLGVAGAATGLAAVGCDGSPPPSAPPPSAPPPSAQPPSGTSQPGDSEPAELGSVDVGLVAAAVATHRELQSAYRGLASTHPSTRPDVRTLVDHLGEHLRALGQPAAPSRPPARTPHRVRAALAGVRDAESSAVADRSAAARLAESGDLARALASIAACHAQHTDALTDLLGDAR